MITAVQEKTVLLRDGTKTAPFSNPSRLTKILSDQHRHKHVALEERKSSGVKISHFVSITGTGELIDTYTGEAFDVARLWGGI